MREETYCSKGRNGWYISNVSKDYEGVFEIPLGVEIICENAFRDCKNITEIVLPNSIKVISGCAFDGCSKLNNIEIPNSVSIIEGWAFANCLSLRHIDIPKSVTNIYNFDVDEDGVTDIPSELFKGSINLESIHVDEGNPHYNSFKNCNAIIETKSRTLIAGCQSTIIPDIVCKIEGGAFKDCKNLKTINIPCSITEIGYGAFEGCTGLKSIVIPDSVKRIKSGAFGRCDNLTSIHLKYENFDMLSIDMDAFRKTDLKNIILYVPIGTGYAYRHHPLFSQFKEVIIER